MIFTVVDLLGCGSLAAQELRVWLTWLRVPGIGWHTFSKILAFSKKRQVSLEEVWASGSLQIEGGLSDIVKNNLNNFKKDFNIDVYLENNFSEKSWIVSLESEDYPYLLKQIADPPWLLFGEGPIPKWSSLPIGIVGTRHNTPYGNQVVEKLISELALYQPLIISGAMYGIDQLAHLTALENQVATLGVLGYGTKSVTPLSAQRFVKNGLDRGMSLISEYHPDIPARKGHFPRRNRVIAGLSQAVIVIEAAQKSGSHIAANLAAEYGRVVGAVPGSIFSPYSEGTKWLLQQGAVLISTALELVEELEGEFLVSSQDTGKATALPSVQQKICDLIKQQLCSTEELISLTRLSPQELSASLSLMEIAGIIEQQDSVWIVKK